MKSSWDSDLSKIHMLGYCSDQQKGTTEKSVPRPSPAIQTAAGRLAVVLPFPFKMGVKLLHSHLK